MKPLVFTFVAALALLAIIQFATSQDHAAKAGTAATVATNSPLVFESGSDPVALVELFTSQGCSSCPPADTWLTKKIGDRKLWKDYGV